MHQVHLDRNTPQVGPNTIPQTQVIQLDLRFMLLLLHIVFLCFMGSCQCHLGLFVQSVNYNTYYLSNEMHAAGNTITPCVAYVRDCYRVTAYASGSSHH